MIMPRGQQLLLPANPLFVLMTLIAALFANMVANISLVGNAAWMPDFLALVVVFWCIHQPRLRASCANPWGVCRAPAM